MFNPRSNQKSKQSVIQKKLILKQTTRFSTSMMEVISSYCTKIKKKLPGITLSEARWFTCKHLNNYKITETSTVSVCLLVRLLP